MVEDRTPPESEETREAYDGQDLDWAEGQREQASIERRWKEHEAEQDYS